MPYTPTPPTPRFAFRRPVGSATVPEPVAVRVAPPVAPTPAVSATAEPDTARKAILSTAATQQEAIAWRNAAKAEGVSLSVFIRKAVYRSHPRLFCEGKT